MKLPKLLACAALLFSTALPLMAQDRMPPIPADKMTDEQKKVAAALIAGPRGALVGPFIPLLRRIYPL